MKLIAEGKFSDGFNGISIVKFYEGETSNKIEELYRGTLESFEVERKSRWEKGEYFMHHFYREKTKCHHRYSDMLREIRKKVNKILTLIKRFSKFVIRNMII